MPKAVRLCTENYKQEKNNYKGKNHIRKAKETMKKRIFSVSVIIAVLLAVLAVLSSCAVESGQDPVAPEKQQGDISDPAPWWKGAFECTVRLTDGTGTDPLIFTLSRDGDTQTAAVTSPASLSGVSVAVSPSGNCIICGIMRFM